MLSGADDGDVGLRAGTAPEVLARRRNKLAPGRWRFLHQCHGDGVVVLEPEEPCEGREADALVTTMPGEPIAVFCADCAVIGLASRQGVVAAVHAGWRGLLKGVVEAAVDAMRALGATDISAVIGASIGPECYEFGTGELALIESRYGPSVVSHSSSGHTALDLRAGVHRALDTGAVSVVSECKSCTACEPGWFSWRARSDTGRQALVVTSVT